MGKTVYNVNEEELIEEVKSRPLLYRVDSDDYRHTFLKDSAWEEITSGLALPGKTTAYINVKIVDVLFIDKYLYFS